MINHKHCAICGKMLPPTQTICVACAIEEARQEARPRVPYYQNFVEPYNKGGQN